MFFLTRPFWIYVFTELVAVHSRIVMETWNTNRVTTWVLLCCRTLDVICGTMRDMCGQIYFLLLLNIDLH